MKSVLIFVAKVGKDVILVITNNRRFFAVIGAIIAIPAIVADLWLDETGTRAVQFVASLVNLYLQLFVTFRTLEFLGAAPPGYVHADATEGRFPSAFFISFVGTAGVLLGLVLLVVPGVLLFGLWSLSMPALAAERISGSAALARSWRLAKPMLGRLLGLAAAWFTLIGLFIGAALLLGFIGLSERWSVLSIDWIVSVLLLVSPVIWAVAYVEAREPHLSRTVAPRAG